MNMKRFMNKKVVAIGLAAGLTLGAAGAAFAYFTDTGSGNGTASTGHATAWSVTNVLTSGGALYPGQNSNTISADVQNVGSGNQALNNLQVVISSITEHAPGTTFTSEAACTPADYALVSTGSWANAGADTANYAVSPAADVVAGDYVTDAADSGGTAATGAALPSGLTLVMVDNTSAAQDQCQGATVNLTVTA